MKYQLQEGRYKSNWQDVGEYPRDQTDLEAWMAIGRQQDTHDGKYHFRIIDETGKVWWTKTPPYEGVKLNLAANPEIWLDALRKDYGIEKALFAEACQAWLDNQ